MIFNFPIGYHTFHENNLLNFQLNRWYSIGFFLKYSEITEVGKCINTLVDSKETFKELGEIAIRDKNWLTGATYLRAAEFFFTRW